MYDTGTTRPLFRRAFDQIAHRGTLEHSLGTWHCCTASPPYIQLSMEHAKKLLSSIQSALNFEGWSEYPLFSQPKGLGRVALLSGSICLIMGGHLILFVQFSLSEETKPRTILLWQWCGYMTLLCTFHLLEFFVTAIYNPTQATADSFLVNHSKAYTAAFIGSVTEFWIRYWICPTINVSRFTYICGLVITVASQALRSMAMKTAGESFNHYIQTTKKANHVLVTNSVYKYMRHPSYVGFFYWSIGSQLLLGNRILAVVSAITCWNFFKRRIAFEEESLCRMFPQEYPCYVAASYTAIPFITTKIQHNKQKGDKQCRCAKQI
jgi:protein-S-isoprenylcysteine O-methyltransferase